MTAAKGGRNTVKVVINKCYGGFSLSAKAVRRLAELQGRECYAYKHDGGTFTRITDEQAEDAFCPFFFDVPNINDVLPPERIGSDGTFRDYNAASEKHAIRNRPENRSDSSLVHVVEELGLAANGKLAELSVVEIPDDVDWDIKEYDGVEWVAEKHQTWG